jgi:histidinol dehydrogenase
VTATLHDLRETAETPKELLERTETDLSAFLETVKPIIESVRADGDSALQRCARDFDKVQADTMSLRATEEEFDSAFKRVDPEVIRSIEFAGANIRRFHEAQKPEEMWLKEMRTGVWAGDRCLPIDSVACYVPRGKGAFPSVVNMTAIPAIVAGVKRPIIITPPGPDGRVDAGTLVAARLAGIREVYKCGGAQGVAAVAYGTQTVPKCLKIVGPGSPYVVAAKRLLAQIIDPGIPAGPSESIILADETTDGALPSTEPILLPSSSRTAHELRRRRKRRCRATGRKWTRSVPHFQKPSSAARMAASSSPQTLMPR